MRRNSNKSGNWVYDVPFARLKLQQLFFDPLFNELPTAAQGVALRAGWLVFALGEIQDDPLVVAQMTMGDPLDFSTHWAAVKRLMTKCRNGNLTWDWWTERREAQYRIQVRASNAGKLGQQAKRLKKQKAMELGGSGL